MNEILSILYESLNDLPPTSEMQAVSLQNDPFFQRLCELTTTQEADDIWYAALSVGAAERDAAFQRGVALGFRLCRELDGIALTR